jgi:hypothetical protein
MRVQLPIWGATIDRLGVEQKAFNKHLRGSALIAEELQRLAIQIAN